MNKRGGDKLISIYWFIVLTIIAGGVVAMVGVFYNSPYDVRSVEAEILAMNIADCVYPGGTLDTRLIASGSFKEEFRDNFMDRCKLNFESKQEFYFGQYYFEINFYDSQNLDRSIFNVSEGNQNWIEDCGIENIGKEKLVKCNEKKFFAKDNSDKVYFVKILSIVRNTEKNVK